MVLNGDECSNALYNANHRELHVSTLMGFCIYLKEGRTGGVSGTIHGRKK